MDKDDIIKRFVIDKLGCDCPAEVFNIIEWQKDVLIDDKFVVNYKINIGNRLLIYIIDIEDAIFLNEVFLKVIKLGITERNDNNFNRFRLVIITDNIGEIGSIAQLAFKMLNINDEKIHVHVMEKKKIRPIDQL
jgi:hypothetical protein